jgi:hypothetical protein
MDESIGKQGAEENNHNPERISNTSLNETTQGEDSKLLPFTYIIWMSNLMITRAKDMTCTAELATSEVFQLKI